jgi:hypothetical protein
MPAPAQWFGRLRPMILRPVWSLRNEQGDPMARIKVDVVRGGDRRECNPIWCESPHRTETSAMVKITCGQCGKAVMPAFHWGGVPHGGSLFHLILNGWSYWFLGLNVRRLPA